MSPEQIEEQLNVLRNDVFDYCLTVFESNREAIPLAHIARRFNRRLRLLQPNTTITAFVRDEPRLWMRNVRRTGGFRIVPRDSFEAYLNEGRPFTPKQKREWWKRFGVETEQDKFEQAMEDMG